MDDEHPVNVARRRLLLHSAALAAALTARPFAAAAQDSLLQPFANGSRELIAYPQKRALLRITTRPPHLETPFSVFNEGPITPNDAFFVRYHLANIPLSIDPASYRLSVTGTVKRPLSLSLRDLKRLAPHEEVVAVNQCSGNSRGFSNPRVFGAQLGNGSMGNARWVGVPLRAVLRKAGIEAGALQVTFNGLDAPVSPATPDFIKALEIEHALGEGPLLAWGMNGSDIPLLNGYPLKLIVPGYFGTYWVKHVAAIEVIDHAFDGHDALFMSTAYRLPDNECGCVAPGTKPEKTRPIARLKVRSFITSVAEGATIAVRGRTIIRGIAFDGGAGIRTVELSMDGGRQWTAARLGRDLGRYSFREWSLPFTPAAAGPVQLRVRATSNAGEIQPEQASWNPSGYARNVIETVNLVAT